MTLFPPDYTTRLAVKFPHRTSHREAIHGYLVASPVVERRARRMPRCKRARANPLPQQTNTPDRAVRAGRLERHHGAHHRAENRRECWANSHHRQSRRRQRHYRHRPRGQGCARRLYAADDEPHVGGEPQPVQKAAVRHRERFAAGEPGGVRAADLGGASIAAGEIAQGFHRARKSQSRQIQFRLRRPRHHAASGGRNAEIDGRFANDARAVQRRRAGVGRSGGRPVAIDAGEYSQHVAAREIGQVARAGVEWAETLFIGTRRAHARRSGIEGLRNRRLERIVSARGHDECDRVAAAHRNRESAGGRGHQRTFVGHGRGGRGQHAGGIQRFRESRDQKMGAGGA